VLWELRSFYVGEGRELENPILQLSTCPFPVGSGMSALGKERGGTVSDNARLFGFMKTILKREAGDDGSAALCYRGHLAEYENGAWALIWADADDGCLSFSTYAEGKPLDELLFSLMPPDDISDLDREGEMNRALWVIAGLMKLICEDPGDDVYLQAEHESIYKYALRFMEEHDASE